MTGRVVCPICGVMVDATSDQQAEDWGLVHMTYWHPEAGYR